MIELDARLTDRMRIAERPGWLRTSAGVLAHSGDSWFWLAGLVLVWWLGAEPWKSWALTLIIAILVTALVVFGVKLAVKRKRPEGEWGKFYRQTDPNSFPSGHAVRAMMLAIIMLGMSPGVGVALIIWAPLVGLARVAMGVHYLSDVVAGMCLGLVIGIIVLVLL